MDSKYFVVLGLCFASCSFYNRHIIDERLSILNDSQRRIVFVWEESDELYKYPFLSNKRIEPEVHTYVSPCFGCKWDSLLSRSVVRFSISDNDEFNEKCKGEVKASWIIEGGFLIFNEKGLFYKNGTNVERLSNCTNE